MTAPTPRPPTPTERIAAGFVQSDAHHEQAALERLAGQHDPAYDAEADRLAALAASGIRMSPTARVALGLHQEARNAAALLARRNAPPAEPPTEPAGSVAPAGPVIPAVPPTTPYVTT